MQLTCDRQELAEALAVAGLVASTRSTRPILANVRLHAEPGNVYIAATDLEVGVQVSLKRVDVARAGEALLPVAHATPIVRELGEDKVELTTEDGVTTIAAGQSTFRIAGDDPADFPSVPGFAVERSISLDRSMLEAMLKKTAFASAVESLRYALNGVLFELSGERLRLVATDGKRLALCERTVENPAGIASQRVVSNKAVQLLSRLASPEDERLELAFGDNQLLARSSRAVLSAQLVQGQFPPYEDVLPKGLDKQVELETQVLTAALRKAALFTTKDSFAVRFHFSYDRLALSSRLAGVGEGRIEIAIPWPYDPLETAFNPVYLLDALKVLDQPRFVLELKESTLPCVLREGEGYRYVIMPIELA